MNKYENLDNFHERLHTLEITIQSGEHKGTLRQKIGGNTFGLSILRTFDPDYFEMSDFCYNDCQFELLDDGESDVWFRCVLKDDDGNESECEFELRELDSMIVKLEIVDAEIV